MSIQKSNYIKLIAMITMLIDHIGVILFPHQIVFRILGRIAFPLFAFQLGIGYRHTKNFKKYILRMLIFGIIIQLFYLCATYIFNVSGDPGYFNIFFTLTLGLLAIHFYENEKYLLLSLIFILPLALSLLGLGFDYGIYGIMIILILYIEKNPVRLAIFMAIFSLAFSFSAQNIQVYCLMSLLFIVYPLSLKVRIPQYVFYLFYPAHLGLLYLIDVLFGSAAGLILAALVAFLLSLIGGHLLTKIRNQPKSFLIRYLPFCLPMILINIFIIISLLIFRRPLLGNSYDVVAIGLYVIFAVFPLMSTISYSIGMHRLNKRTTSKRFWFILPIIIILTCSALVGLNMYVGSNYVRLADKTESIQEEINYLDYAPFRQDNKVVKTNIKPSITFNEGYPRLDGATAAYPVYSAIAETLYKGLNESTARDYVKCNQTDGAYERLIKGKTDIVFGVRPSKEQIEAAGKNGVSFEYTKIAKEAFVFFVNKQNPVEDLSVEQIQKIYTKQIRNWKELNGESEKITPFQRPVNSGSQTIMLNTVMQGATMPQPIEEETVLGMGEIIYRTANYRNYRGAIGYSFRYYATVMNPNAEIKLLSVNGTSPKIENIKNDEYPFTVDVYAVTTNITKDRPNVQKLLDWILSEQGQSLIEKCGYVAIK